MSDTETYYFVPGMMYPLWCVDGRGDFHNLEADTDMGDLSPGEFTEMFGAYARRVTREQVDKYLAGKREGDWPE
jgi:hypothetical protein